MVKIPEHAAQVLSALEGAGFGAWCVGGCVRDSLLGRTPQDWDVTTAAVPERVLAIFGDRAVPTGLAHGTVTVRTAGGVVEVTTLRRDGTYRDHRRPQSVTFTDSLEEDLCRRDFTVNAMALDLRGELADPLGGRADLDAGLLRCVGEPDRRFREDALRILRGVRFAAALGFAVEQETDRSLRANRALLALIAPERIWAELKGLLTAPGAAEALRAYPEVIGVFWPEVLDMVGFPQRNRHHCYDVWEHTLHALAQVPPELELRLTMLLHDIGKPGCCTIDASGCGHFKGHPARSAVSGRTTPPGRRWSGWWRGTTGISPGPGPAWRRPCGSWGRRTCGGCCASSGRTTWHRTRPTGPCRRRSAGRRPSWTGCWPRGSACPWTSWRSGAETCWPWASPARRWGRPWRRCWTR